MESFFYQLSGSSFIFVKNIWELSSYHHISKKIVWIYYYASISISSSTNSGVKIFVSLKGFRIWNNICTLFGVWLLPTCLSQKSPKFWIFLFKSILKLELWNDRSQFSLKLLVFLGHDMKRCALSFFGKQVHINFWEGFLAHHLFCQNYRHNFRFRSSVVSHW